MSVHGTPNFLEQPGRRGWSESRGAFRERVWEGPVANFTDFLGSTLPGGFSDYVVEDDGELCVVRATYNVGSVDNVGTPETNGLVENTWELEGNDLEKSLWEHPNVQAELEGLTTTELANFRGQVEDILAGKDVTPPAGDLGVFIQKLARGVEAFTVSQYVLRNVRTVRRNTSLAPGYANTNKWFTYTQLTAAEPTLPGYSLIASSGLSDLVWLKRTPTVRPTSGGLWQFEVEYWAADEWDTWVYEQATGA